MSTGVLVERMWAQDISQNVALSNSVAWPDTESEWQVIHDAAFVLGAFRDGELLGQGALGLYDGAATIAKMVVAEQARRLGIGGAILDALLAEAERRTLPTVGLVATPLGQPLYESRAFEPVGEVVIMMGTPELHEAHEPALPISDVEQMLQLERRFMVGSRAAMLRGRFQEACATALMAGGFALVSPHPRGARVGPIIAEHDETARALARALFRAVPGPVRVDVPGEQREFRHWLASLGLLEMRVHLEMARGGALPWQVPERFGLAAQAWG